MIKAIWFLFLAFVVLLSSGCTTSLLWNGSHGNEYQETNWKVEAVDNKLLLADDGTICMPYALKDTKDFTKMNKELGFPLNGYYVLGKAMPSFFYGSRGKQSGNLMAIINEGPIPIEIEEISIYESKLTGYKRSRLETLLQAVPYLNYSKDLAERDRIWERPLRIKSDIKVEVAFSLPKKHIWVEDEIKSHVLNSQLPVLDERNATQIMQYYTLVRNATRNEVTSPNRAFVLKDFIKPVGWIDATGKIFGNGKEAGSISGIALVNEGATTDECHKGPIYIFILIKPVLEQEHVVIRNSFDILTRRNYDDSAYYNNIIHPERQRYAADKCAVGESIETLHVKKTKLALQDDTTERRTLPFIIKIVLTPVTLVADVIITPLYVLSSYFIFERMPR